MAGESASTDLLNQLAILTSLGAAGDLSDADLLRRLLSGPDAVSRAALTALVDRHGPMVLSACHRVLRDPHDAHDAFQATFLILAHRAGSIRKAHSVASWLHGVALRVAARVRTDAARRRVFERRAAAMKAVETATEGDSPECWPELHEEIARLPERYREPVVLCYLEGMTAEAVAHRLGCPRGTVLSRLARGRERLRAVLTRRGLVLPAALLAVATEASPAAAALPVTLFEATVRACLSFTGGRAPAAATTTATTIARGVISAMLISKLKTLGVVGGLLAGLALGGAVASVFSATPQAVAPLQASSAAPASAALKQQDTTKAMAGDQLKLARQALEELEDLGKNARVEIGDARIAVWERRQVEALKASGVGKAELVSALERYVKRMKDLSVMAEARRQQGRITHPDVLDWQYRVLEAEMWLNEEKSR